MKLDDSHPDYFDDEAPGGASGTQPATGGDDPRRITFDDGDSNAPQGGDAARDPETAQGTPQPAAQPRRHRRLHRFIAWSVAVVAVVLAVTVWLRYFSPCVTDAQMRCYIINVEKRGLVFKTYEADVVSEQSLTDTARVYSRDLSFSVDDPELARELQQAQGTGRLVTVSYETYNATLPWRGASKSVIVGVTF